MTTIKSYTGLKQSKKLAEFLSLESADMCYKCIGEDPYDVILRPYSEWKEEYKGLLVSKEADVIPCWSLAALLNILPILERKGYQKAKPILLYNVAINKWIVDSHVYTTDAYDNPVDACYEMIEKLYELKML